MRMQLAVELDDAGRDEFYRWVEAVAVAVNLGQPQLTLGQAVRALIRAAAGSEAVTAAVIDQLKIEAIAARPELDKALAYLREGDVLVITRLSRAMRSLKHLLALADDLRERGAGLVVLRQQIDTTTPTGRLAFHVLGAIDEFQRELIIEGTREGLDAARARGRTGGRKPKLSAAKAATVRRMYQATGPDGKRQHTVAEIAQTAGVHRTTVYDYLNKEG